MERFYPLQTSSSSSVDNTIFQNNIIADTNVNTIVSTSTSTNNSTTVLTRHSRNVRRNIDNEKRAKEIVVEYTKTLEFIFRKDASYATTSIIEGKRQCDTEFQMLQNDTYYNYTEGNNIVSYMLALIEWFKDSTPRITFKTMDKMIANLRYYKDSKYLLSNIIKEPFELITIENSVLHFNQAYSISREFDITVSDKLLLEKWVISTLHDNNGSFYKIKSHAKSNNKYVNHTDRCYKQGYYWLLREFCKSNNIMNKYTSYLEVLNSILTAKDDNKYLFTLPEYIDMEKKIGDTVIELFYDESNTIESDKFNAFIEGFERKKSVEVGTSFIFEPEQKRAIKNGIKHKMSIITGPPGTGKSAITEAIVDWYNICAEDRNIETNISLMAPTGKAMKGLLEKCSNIKNTTICGTLHKCILNTFPKIKKNVSTKDNEFMVYNNPDHDAEHTSNDNKETSENDELPSSVDIMIVDEASMIDIFMFKKILYWCEQFNSKLILLGDIQQLPPVSSGRPFESIIKSNLIKCTYLTKIKRQDDGNLKNLIINLNQRTLTMDHFDGDSTKFIEHSFSDSGKTFRICKKLVEEYGKPNISFISPENNKEGGVFEMNKMLQMHVYNPEEEYQHGYFKHGDYVIRTENDYTLKTGKIRVNGDTGRIYFEKTIGTNNRSLLRAYVKYDDDEHGDREDVSLPSIKDKFSLNYCSTVHKFQGSQKAVIVFIVSRFHSSLSWGTQRMKLAYTAISRATKTVIVLGDKNIFFDIQKCKEEKFNTLFMKKFDEVEIEDVE
mgnify:CR=1 FL=1|tara:strand:- start:1786 stop:4122 length:2337 start_codon:yes stop_codon:yes gene_type:complete